MAKVAPPLTERQATRIEPLGLLADEPAGLIAAWNKIEVLWTDAVAQASRLPSERLDTRLNSEWSFIETLRHLIFVTDAWIGDVVPEKASPYDPLGPPTLRNNHSRTATNATPTRSRPPRRTTTATRSRH